MARPAAGGPAGLVGKARAGRGHLLLNLAGRERPWSLVVGWSIGARHRHGHSSYGSLPLARLRQLTWLVPPQVPSLEKIILRVFRIVTDESLQNRSVGGGCRVSGT